MLRDSAPRRPPAAPLADPRSGRRAVPARGGSPPRKAPPRPSQSSEFSQINLEFGGATLRAVGVDLSAPSAQTLLAAELRRRGSTIEAIDLTANRLGGRGLARLPDAPSASCRR